MNIHCPCGSFLHPLNPIGRWAIDPTLFLRQNPFPLPLHHAILVSQQGERRIKCDQCGLGHEVLWDIVYSADIDVQGSKVRYVMSEGTRYMECPSCGMRWPEGDPCEFHPPVVDAHNPCPHCVHVLVSAGVGVHIFKEQGF